MTTVPTPAARQALNDAEADRDMMEDSRDSAIRAREQAQQRASLAHAARRAKAAQLDDIKRALLDTGVIQEGDPYGHADLADVIRQTMTDRAHTERGDTAAVHLDRSAARAWRQRAEEYAGWLAATAQACVNPEPPTWGNLANTVKELAQDAERFKADHLAACRTIAEMHEAATGRTGMGAIRGVVEDVADVRARAEELSLLNQTACKALDTMQHDRDAQRARAEQAEAERDQAQRDAKEAKERARIAHVAAYRLQQRTPDAAQRVLDRIRNARHTGTVWTELGMYYGLTAGQAGQGARAWRSMAERLAVARAEKAEERAETASALGARYMGDAERYRAAWQNARRRAQQATERAERYRTSRNHWTRQALNAAATPTEAHANAAVARVRALHSAVIHNGRTICTDCSGYADGSTDNGPAPFPCPTITALDHARYTTEAGR
ncbi:hypothetical protein [Streptomyces sp. NPDC096095]|uniref:hypothetical protein n=1 Tax=Streptomyces sp. NPDC096095 TaxID=3155545 RepID=UPI003320808F